MDKQEIIARISNATPLGLLLISYDLFLDAVAVTKENIASGEESAVIEKDIEYLQKILTEITRSLNMEQELSQEILPIYMHVNKLLIECGVKVKRKSQVKQLSERINIIESIMKILLEGLEALEDTGEPINPAVQQVYAGLTYQKDGKLNEFVAEGSGRSFEA